MIIYLAFVAYKCMCRIIKISKDYNQPISNFLSAKKLSDVMIFQYYHFIFNETDFQSEKWIFLFTCHLKCKWVNDKWN